MNERVTGSRWLRGAKALLASCALCGVAPCASAAAIAWSGASSSLWANGANWVGGLAPADDTTSDVAVFDFATLPVHLPDTDMARVAGVVFGDGSTAVPAFTLAGKRLTLGAVGIAKLAASGAVTVSADLRLDAAQTWSNDSTTRLTVSGGLNIDGHELSFDGSGATLVTGDIGGTAGLVKKGPGSLELEGSNSYSGGTTIEGGTLIAGKDGRKDTLGPDSAPLTFDGEGATLKLAGTVNNSERNYYFLQSATIDTAGYDLTLNGALAGEGGLTKKGEGELTLAGANTYTGVTTVLGGRLVVDGGEAIADSGSVVLADAAGVAFEVKGSTTIGALSGGGETGGMVHFDGHVLSVGADDGSSTFGGQFSGNQSSQLRKVGAGTLTLTYAEPSDAFKGSVRIDEGTVSIASIDSFGERGSSRLLYFNDGGRLETTADMTFVTRRFEFGTAGSDGIAGVIDVAADTRVDIQGVIRNATGSSAGLRKAGAGTLSIDNDHNAYVGETLVSAGTLRVLGSIAQSAVTVQQGATLAGSGTVGSTLVEAGGTLSPGNPPAVLTVDGDLTQAGGSLLIWELFGDTVTGRGTGFDGIDVSGALAFSGPSSLQLVFSGAGSSVDWTSAFWDVDHLGAGGWLVYAVEGAVTGLEQLAILAADWQDGGERRFSTVRPEATFGLWLGADGVYLEYQAGEPPGPLPAPGVPALVAAGLAGWAAARRARPHSPRG